ncbi:MAG: RidA family protein [Polyangiaceae bacterium]|nr:RidA family protein [Polyangiaceae bacterium]
MATIIHPPGFPRPRGYSNGVLASGRVLTVAGQIGWDAREQFESDELVPQLGQALDNVLAVVRAAGGDVEHLSHMTIYVTDLDAYRGAGKALGEAWRARMGRHYPSMALVGVAGLVEPRAKVEIEAIAVLPEERA